jgi:DNA polymerase-3 subunit beta
MKFSTERDIFLKVLNEVSKALPTRSTLPILQNILFELKDNSLSLTATNLDFTIQERIDVMGEEDGKFTLPGKTLQQIIGTLPPTTLHFHYSSGTTKVITDTGNYTLMGFSPEDFPQVKKIEEGEVLQFPKDLLLEGYQSVGFCAAREDPRQFLTGVLWHVKGNEVRFVASDSHKLGLWKKKIEGISQFEAILPKNIFEFLKSRDEEMVEVRFAHDTLGLYFENAFLITRLIEGPYAPYEDVLPKDEGNVLVTSREDLIGSLRRISVFTQSPTYLVKWHLAAGNLKLYASSPEIGEAEEKITGEYDGVDMDIGFNSQYLLEILRHLGGEEVKFHFYSPLSATLIHSSVEEEGKSLLFLLMPVKLE